MEAVNTKSLFSKLCNTLEKLESGQITANDAIATTKVIAQVNQLLNYELKRAIIMANENTRKYHRNIETKTFNSLPEPKEGHIVYAQIESNDR
jgi:hypothetical protein